MKAPELIGKKATIVGLALEGDNLGEDYTVAHICLDIEGGPRIFIEAYEWTVALKLTEEPR